MKDRLKVRNRIWIEGSEGTFLGNGRIQLLDAIHKTGSIKQAAKDLKMSYRKAWSLLESMNRQAREAYIVKSTGGEGGGGTVVTEAGLKAIKQFRELDRKCQEFLDRQLRDLKL